ncbi:MAG: DNA cytosine methyltransferase [Pirellulaceae bacterium]
MKHSLSDASSWRVLELFAGVGGLATAWPEAPIVAAVDINQRAADIYRRNYPHPYYIRTIESLRREDVQGWNANFWWLSPPCQPFSRRGARSDSPRDIADPRALGLLRIIDLLDEAPPQAIGLENVIGFENSAAHRRLMLRLERLGYAISTRELCPTELGWPNRRPRFYLLAAREGFGLRNWLPLPTHTTRLADLLDPPEIAEQQPELWISTEQFTKFGGALDRIDAADSQAVAACFASSYGKTLMHAGSYLRTPQGYRRFSPREMSRILGFPTDFELGNADLRTLWKLFGNSLSLPAVRYVLSHVEHR